MSLATKKLSRILRARETTLIEFEAALSGATSKTGILNAVAEDHDRRLSDALRALDCPLEATADDVYRALLAKVEESDRAVYAHLKQPDCMTSKGCETVATLAKEIAGVPKGYFLKREVAERLFRKNPPRNLMRELKVESVDDLLRRFSLNELFPAIRFAEDSHWLNDVFFHPYAMLSPEDFEEREVSVVVLPEAFRDIGRHFAGKKLHHISHLKELGVIFVMPVSGEDHAPPPGVTLEILTLVLHYLHEVPFYSKIFRRYAASPDSFAANLVDALRGEVLPQPPDGGSTQRRFLIVQRYLAKEDATDPRLFIPHVNPEAMHWRFVEEDLDAFSRKHAELGLQFWKDLESVGEYFPVGATQERYRMRGVIEAVAVSFDLIDNLISHNRRSPVLEKYLYHQQEALWNELFEAYLGREAVERMVEENLERGYIEISSIATAVASDATAAV